MKSLQFWTTLSLASTFTEQHSETRSNQTHLVWKYNDQYDIQSIETARTEAYRYLREHAMELDRPFWETLGFHTNTDDNDIDGLGNGLVQQVLNVSIQAKIDFLYTDILPKDMWQSYILNYSHLNEARSNVRRLLRDRLVEPLLLNQTLSLAETVHSINRHMWEMLSTPSIRFVAGQTPAIFDSMSVIAFGYASCTGTSILFAEALRAAGIPARIAGTNAWNGDPSKGNHNWVEVYNGTEWQFLEPSPSVEPDSLDRDPCSRWFCNAQHMDHGTCVYAATLERSGLYFPLAWEPTCMAVPAINRTEYYRRVCSSCGREQDEKVSTS